MSAQQGDTKAAKDGNAFYGYLYDKQKPVPAPTPILDALLRAIALHIVRSTSFGWLMVEPPFP